MTFYIGFASLLHCKLLYARPHNLVSNIHTVHGNEVGCDAFNDFARHLIAANEIQSICIYIALSFDLDVEYFPTAKKLPLRCIRHASACSCFLIYVSTRGHS